MSVKALQDYIFTTKYSRHNADLGRRETFDESVHRVMSMHRMKYKDYNIEKEIKFCSDAIKDRLVLGSQRALQFGGTPILKKEARIYNCTTSYCDRPRFFQECLWLLLCGCGTGFSVQKHHIAKLPGIRAPHSGVSTFKIPDTIEGWADSLGILLASYGIAAPEFLSESWRSSVEFDYSEVRPEGASLASGSGKAPGPGPLRNAIEKIRDLLTECIGRGQTHLRPIDAYDIVMHASDAVLSGGVRRSATICMFSVDDEEMMTSKTGDWFIKNPQRGRSNNSAVLLRDSTSRETFNGMMKSVKEFGEPGFVWADSTEIMYNPCFAPETRLATDHGLVRIEDLFHAATANRVVTDSRAGKGDVLDLEAQGVQVRTASPVKLTQRNAKVFALTTEHGHVVKATANHLFPTTDGRKMLKDLSIGDTLLLPSGVGEFGTSGTADDGFILGSLTGNGTFDSLSTPTEAFVDMWEDDFDQCDRIGPLVAARMTAQPLSEHARRKTYAVDWVGQTQVGTKQKRRIGGVRLYRWLMTDLGIEQPVTIKASVPECVWRGSRAFVKGYLDGLFSTDGTVNVAGHDKSQTVSLRLSQSNPELLRQIQVLLGNFAIMSRIYLRREAGQRLLPDSQRLAKLYDCKANYDLVLSRPNCVVFETQIGLSGKKGIKLAKALDARGRDCQKPERFLTKVASIMFDRVTDVYCLEQSETNTVIAEGVVTGQCVEIGLYPTITRGEVPELAASGDPSDQLSGFAFCNLCEINMKACSTPALWERACRAAAILGTMQAGYSSFEYLGPVSEAIAKREALLGCSMTGMMDNPKMAFDPQLQQKMAQLILDVNAEFAPTIGVRPTARATCVKPAGTTSCILGTSSGIHAHHAKRYFRRAQGNKLEGALQYFALHNPRHVEDSVWSANKTDKSVIFCIEISDDALTKGSVNAIELLQYVKLTQNNWVAAGRVDERCAAKFLRHNVSNTINVQTNEWDAVAEFIYDNRDSFAGISLLSHSGDKDYPQAPFCEVFTPSEILSKYGDGCLMASGLIVDGCHAFSNNLWAACSCALGIGESLTGSISAELTPELQIIELQARIKKIDWVRRSLKFAKNYFGGDVKKMSYCLKDVHNWKLWCDLNREYQDVDWALFSEDQDNTKDVSLDAACAGGKCEILST